MKQVELNQQPPAKKHSCANLWSRFAPVTKDDLNKLTTLLNKIMDTQAELAQALKDLKAQGIKIAAEQQARADALNKSIADLQAIIAAGGPVTQEVKDALADVQATFKSLDDTIPDAPAS